MPIIHSPQPKGNASLSSSRSAENPPPAAFFPKEKPKPTTSETQLNKEATIGFSSRTKLSNAPKVDQSASSLAVVPAPPPPTSSFFPKVTIYADHTTNRIMDLEQTIVKLHEEHRFWKRKVLNDHDLVCQKLRHDNDQLLGSLEASRTELHTLTMSNHQALEDLTAWHERAHLDRLSQLTLVHRNAMKSLTNEVNELKTQLTSLQRENGTLITERKDMANDSSAAKVLQAKSESESIALQTKVIELRSQIGVLEHELMEERKDKEIRERNREVEDEIAKQKTDAAIARALSAVRRAEEKLSSSDPVIVNRRDIPPSKLGPINGAFQQLRGNTTSDEYEDLLTLQPRRQPRIEQESFSSQPTYLSPTKSSVAKKRFQ